MKKISIALIEDNATDLTTLIKELTNSGKIEVKHNFMHGGDFITHINESPVDFEVAVIDYRMPVLNGLETFRNLFAKKVGFKLLLVSHGYYNSVMKELIEMGTQNYCRKTCDMIVESVERLTSNRQVYDNNDPILFWEGLTQKSALQMLDESHWRRLLSSLDIKIIRLLVSGLNSREIAKVLHYEASSIEKYRSSIMRNLELRNSQQLASWAITHGVVRASFLMQTDIDIKLETSSNPDIQKHINFLIEEKLKKENSTTPKK